MIKRIIRKLKHRHFCKLNSYFCPDCIYHDFVWEGITFRGNRCRYPKEEDMNDTTFQGDGKVAYVPVVVSAKQQPMTNADRIRAMTDEELASWVWGAESAGRAYGPRGKKAWLDWLKQEAEP